MRGSKVLAKADASLASRSSAKPPCHGSLNLFFMALVLLACERSPEERSLPNPAAHLPAATTPLPPSPPQPAGPRRVAASGFPCDVDEILARKCRRCHSTPTAHGAPFTLLTWADTHKLMHDKPIFRSIGSTVRSGFMPYRVPLNPPVEPLALAEKERLLAWVEEGAPSSTGPCPEPGAAGGTAP